MEEVIRELTNHLNKISAREILEITMMASSRIHERNIQKMTMQANQKPVNRQASLDSLLNEPNTRMNTLKKLQKLTGFDTDIYLQCEEEVRASNPERTDIFFGLQALINTLKMGVPDFFVEFELLSDILRYIKMDNSLQLKLFVYLVHNNARLCNYQERKLFLPDYQVILNYDYKNIKMEELVAILREKSLGDYFKEEKPANPEGQEEVYKVFKNSLKDYTPQLKASLELDRIFDKETIDLTDEDYQKTLDNMEFLSFREIGYRLVKQMKRDAASSEHISNTTKENSSELPKTSKGTPNEKPATEVKEIKKGPSQKEKRHVYHEIDKLYDIENFKAKTTLSLDEIIYLLSLMYSIDMDESIITKFLESVMHQYQKNNPIAICYQTQEKFARLMRDNSEIKEHQEMLAYILHDFNEVKGLSIFTCSDAEYKELKDLIAEEIDALMNLSEGNYTYEIEKAECLLKINKGE